MYIRRAGHLTGIYATATEVIMRTAPPHDNEVANSLIPPNQASPSLGDSNSEVWRSFTTCASTEVVTEVIEAPYVPPPSNERSEGSFHSLTEVGLERQVDLESGVGREEARKRRGCLMQGFKKFVRVLVWLACWPIHMML